MDSIQLVMYQWDPLSLLDGYDLIIGFNYAEGGWVPGDLYGSNPPVLVVQRRHPIVCRGVVCAAKSLAAGGGP